MGRTNRIGLALAALVVVLAMLSAGSRLVSVHQETSDWALWPRVVPSKVQFAGRDYNCGPDPRALGAVGRSGATSASNDGAGGVTGDGLAGDGAPGPADAVLQGLAIRGKTAGGADIYSSPSAVPDTIWIPANGGVYGCALMGGR